VVQRQLKLTPDIQLLFVLLVAKHAYSCPSSVNSFCANDDPDQNIDTAYQGEWAPEGGCPAPNFNNPVDLCCDWENE
jgi:hypothetical protein